MGIRVASVWAGVALVLTVVFVNAGWVMATFAALGMALVFVSTVEGLLSLLDSDCKERDLER